MSTYDHIRCHYPLPVEGANALEFQTGSTDAQFMEDYEIWADGTLWHRAYDTEDRSDPNAEGLMRLVGSLTRVNERWERDFTTGEIRLSGTLDGSWSEASTLAFSIYFVQGELKFLVDLVALRRVGQEAGLQLPPL